MGGRRRSDVLRLDGANFGPLVETGKVMVIDFSASWCGPCRSFVSVFNDSAERNNDVVFASVDVDRQKELAKAFDVKGVPTVAVMRAGALVFIHEGTLSKRALDDVIRQARTLDVDKIRRSIGVESGTL